jgi:hypothetical protein
MPASHVCGGPADRTCAPTALQVGHVRLPPSRAIVMNPLSDVLHSHHVMPFSGRSPNGEPTYSHDHSHVDNRCGPSSPPSCSQEESL